MVEGILKDAVFHQGGVKGADLALVNTDGTDDIFSLIEVKKGMPDEPALIPPDAGRAFPGYASGTKYSKGENSTPADKKDRRK